MSDYFVLEIFPKLGLSFTPIEGQVKFNFQDRECFIITQEESTEFKINTGAKSCNIIPQYNPVNLYVKCQKDDIEKGNQFIVIERICDILSFATASHVAYFLPRLSEYSYVPGWGITKVIPSKSFSEKLTYKGSKSTFLNVNGATNIIQKIYSSPYKERILASIHMNRLAKYKSSTHITEALTDCINSLEALYMIEKGNYQSSPNYNIIPKLSGSKVLNKTEMLEYFIKKYSTRTDSYKFASGKDPYAIRSAYLHRGMLIEPASKIIVPKNLKEAEESFKFNNFYASVFSAIYNFVTRKGFMDSLD
ncbi:MAG TPA: hypothetical protein DCK79_05215 [Candidatus Atribacteria bacterium]|nr:hypothetical protein [Candidatus Atribacteria bacterium]